MECEIIFMFRIYSVKSVIVFTSIIKEFIVINMEFIVTFKEFTRKSIGMHTSFKIFTGSIIQLKTFKEFAITTKKFKATQI